MTSRLRYLLAPLLAASIWTAAVPAEPPPPAAVPQPAALTRAERQELNKQAWTAFSQKDFASCADFFEKAGDSYQAACCHSLAGNSDASFAKLALAIDGKNLDLYRLDRDPDFAAIHADPRWATERARLAAKTAAGDVNFNPELRKIHAEDQADRRPAGGGKIDWTVVTPRDQARRARTHEILAAGGAKSSLDYFSAAMVFQHGELLEEIDRAHELAKKAVELDQDNDPARWLVTATEDRSLMFQKKPQKWGTQFHVVDGKWALWEVDESLVTDAQRVEWNVPTLAQAQARVLAMNATPPKP